MNDLAELERRISAALTRIGTGIDQLRAAGAAETAAAGEVASASEEVVQLREALEAERTANAQLTARLRAVKARDGKAGAALEQRVAELTRQLDVQGLESQRMKKNMIQLREALRSLREEAQEKVEAHLINKAMLAELESLRSERAAEAAELAELLSEIGPIVQEAAQDSEDEKEATDA
ncbi:hypothetical protein D2N39_13520 [Gemmobacter lutimaris]|uniref:Uncharacterized protein n=1 Tax=Gemmobacter lutimaris TaxID=2306023 RepID=A0A398BP31_9RHOB|nr:hypothetical protein [Gemmobacter lutimaris]RID91267.1 hypothetical protein D2N39_13520 [Gemmobacter lutimaris]